MNREIKFKCLAPYDGYRLIGYERYTPEYGWQFTRYNELAWHDGVFMANERGELLRLQFTGLKDKNGVDVYEGYVVKWTDKVHNHGTGVTPVKYSEAFARFCGNSHPTNDGFRPSWELEVIGNIYEHPHLTDPTPSIA